MLSAQINETYNFCTLFARPNSPSLKNNIFTRKLVRIKEKTYFCADLELDSKSA